MGELAARTPRAEARALGVLGLACRAGLVVVGTRAVRDAARRGELAAVLVAGDATENARQRLAGVVSRGIPLASVGDRRGLGATVGRAGVVAVGLKDAKLALRIVTGAGAELESKSGAEASGPRVRMGSSCSGRRS
ncbi:MAG: L7Ae/L30e/S12e/Gadd45 family ribosomal protein [Gemmatimonadota bacterium]